MLSVSGRQWQAGAPAPAVGGSNKRQRACSGRLALTAPVLTDPGLDLDGGLESACIHAALPEAPPAGLQVTMLVSTLFPWLWPAVSTRCGTVQQMSMLGSAVLAPLDLVCGARRLQAHARPAIRV